MISGIIYKRRHVLSLPLTLTNHITYPMRHFPFSGYWYRQIKVDDAYISSIVYSGHFLGSSNASAPGFTACTSRLHSFSVRYSAAQYAPTLSIELRLSISPHASSLCYWLNPLRGKPRPTDCLLPLTLPSEITGAVRLYSYLMGRHTYVSGDTYLTRSISTGNMSTPNGETFLAFSSHAHGEHPQYLGGPADEPIGLLKQVPETAIFGKKIPPPSSQIPRSASREKSTLSSLKQQKKKTAQSEDTEMQNTTPEAGKQESSRGAGTYGTGFPRWPPASRAARALFPFPCSHAGPRRTAHAPGPPPENPWAWQRKLLQPWRFCTPWNACAAQSSIVTSFSYAPGRKSSSECPSPRG